jgi:hypothetical protein
MNGERQRPGSFWKRMARLYLLIVALSLLLVSVAFADDCYRDPTNLQDCMRTGMFREALTIIAALLGTTPIAIAHHVLGLSTKEIATLILRDAWSPETELAEVVRQLRDMLLGTPGPPSSDFRDLPGPSGRPTVEHIRDGKRATRILDDLGVLRDLRRLRRGDPQLQQKLDMMLNQVKDHKRVKAIALDWKKVRDPSGKWVEVVDEKKVVIVVEEPEYRLPPSPSPPGPTGPKPATGPAVKPQPKSSPKPGRTTKPKSKGVTKKKPPPATPPRSIVDLYRSDRAKFRRCQDLPYARAQNRPPPRGGHDKADVHKKMGDAHYEETDSGQMTDPDADRKWARLQNGDIVALGINKPPTEAGADHYAVVEKGRVHEVQNLPRRGRYNSVPLSRAKAWFSKRQRMLHPDGRPIIGKQSRKPLIRAAYKYFKVYHKRTR